MRGWLFGILLAISTSGILSQEIDQAQVNVCLTRCGALPFSPTCDEGHECGPIDTSLIVWTDLKNCMFTFPSNLHVMYSDGEKEHHAARRLRCNGKKWEFRGGDDWRTIAISVASGGGFYQINKINPLPNQISDNCIEQEHDLNPYPTTGSRGCPYGMKCTVVTKATTYQTRIVDKDGTIKCRLRCNNGNAPMYSWMPTSEKEAVIRVIQWMDMYVDQKAQSYNQTMYSGKMTQAGDIVFHMACSEGAPNKFVKEIPVKPKPMLPEQECVNLCGWPSFKESLCPEGYRCSPLSPTNSVLDKTTCQYRCPKGHIYPQIDHAHTNPMSSFECDGTNQLYKHHGWGTVIRKKGDKNKVYVSCIEGVVKAPHTAEEIAEFRKQGPCHTGVFPPTADQYYPSVMENVISFTEETTYYVKVGKRCRVYCDNGGNGMVFRHNDAYLVRTTWIDNDQGSGDTWYSDNGSALSKFFSFAWCMPRANPDDAVDRQPEPRELLNPTCGCHEPPFLLPSKASGCKALGANSVLECVDYVKQKKTKKGYTYTCGPRARSDIAQYFMVDADKIPTDGTAPVELKSLTCADGLSVQLKGYPFVDVNGHNFYGKIVCLKKKSTPK